MGLFDDLKLQRLVIHKIDNTVAQFIPTESEGQISPIAEEFIVYHSQDAYAHIKGRDVVFNEPDTNLVCQAVGEIFSDVSTFLMESQKIGKRLFEHSGSKNILPGDLAIAFFENPSNEMLAFLKIDESEFFATELRREGGRNVIVWKKYDKGFSKRIPLQKAFFVYHEKGELNVANWSMRALDKKAPEIEVAKFWLRDFLNVRFRRSDKENTKTWWDQTRMWIDKTYSEPIRKLEMQNRAGLFLEGRTHFSIDNFTDFMFADDEEEKERYKSEIQERGLADFDFELIQEAVSSAKRQGKVVLDDEITIITKRPIRQFPDRISEGSDNNGNYVKIYYKTKTENQ